MLNIQSIKDNCALIFFIALFLLSFIFFNIFISSALFIINISITPLVFILSFLLSTLTNLHLAKKNDIFKKNKIRNMLVTIIIPIVVILLAIFVNGKVLDYSWDGNSYQKATTGLLASGWNPLYEDYETFDATVKQPIRIRDESPTYIDHYPRAASIFAANVYKFTGNIETGKCLNTICIIMLFCFTLSFLLHKNKSFIFSLLFSICVITYSVVCAQFLTNYIDLIVYTFFYLLVYLFFAFEEENFILPKKDLLFLFFMVLVLSINIKVSLFGYAGVFCLGYYIWYIYRFVKNKIDKKFFIEFSIISAISVLLGVFVVGLAVYPKNLIEHGHPFYPLMGKDKVEIMIQNQPDYFKNKSPLEKFTIATFSKVANITADSKKEAEYKIPFTFNDEETTIISAADTRISGNGVLFGGILIISLILSCCCLYNLFKTDKKVFTMYAIFFSITLMLILFLNEAWWARYFPQIYLVVLASILLLNRYANKKFFLFIQYAFIAVLLVNNFITFYNAVSLGYRKNVIYNTNFSAFENENYNKGTTFIIYTKSFHGAKYNIMDKYHDYSFIFKSDYSDKNGTEKKFFDGFLEWRCEK